MHRGLVQPDHQARGDGEESWQRRRRGLRPQRSLDPSTGEQREAGGAIGQGVIDYRLQYDHANVIIIKYY